MEFCSHCGARVERAVPEGDDRVRHVCRACGRVHYQNPRAVVGCLVEQGDALLLCRRAIEPARHRWTFPCGFQELEETALEGALRETWEEARARLGSSRPFAHLDIPHISQSYLIWRGPLAGDFAAGPESEEVALVPVADLPWDELAFPTIRLALELYVADRSAGRWPMHFGTVRWNGSGDRFDVAQYRLDDHVTVP